MDFPSPFRRGMGANHARTTLLLGGLTALVVLAAHWLGGTGWAIVTENVTLSRTPHHYMNVLSPRGADMPAWLPKPQRVDVGAIVRMFAR